MRTNEIRKAVFRIIEKYTDIEIKSDTLLRDDAGLDSMEQLEICNDIESEFNLIIEDSELFTPKVENATAGEIVEMVIAKLKEQDAQQKEAPEEETEGQTEGMSDKNNDTDISGLRRRLALMVNARSILHFNNMITESENDRIHSKIMQFAEKNKIQISRAQIDSVNFTYDDNAKDEEE